MRAGREGAPVADTPRRLSADKGTLNNSASVAKPSRPVAGPGSARPGKGGLSADKVEAYPRIRARPLIYWRISSQTVPPGRKTGQRPPRPMAGALHPPGRALPFGLFAPLLRHGRGLSADKGSTADLLAWAGRGVRARLPPTPPVAYPRIRVCCRERSSPNRTAPNRGHRLPPPQATPTAFARPHDFFPHMGFIWPIFPIIAFRRHTCDRHGASSPMAHGTEILSKGPP